MNRKDLRNYNDVTELWDEELEEELSYLHLSDVMEDFKDK